MSGRLHNKVTLITGTAGGQGRAAALRFAAEGALLVGCDVKAEANAETVRMVETAGGKMVGMAPVDLGDPDQARAWVEEAAGIYGRIDVLYNNAGIPHNASVEETSIEDWHFTIRNEVDLVFYVTKYAWPFLTRSGGVIISTASVAGHTPLSGLVSHCTAKGAVLAMSRAFAAEGAPYGIRAVTISPGPIVSPGTEAYFADPKAAEHSANSTLLKRLGQVDEIASVAVFLASDESSYMTGCDVVVDGGRA